MKNTIDFVEDLTIKDLTPVDLQAITAIKEYIKSNPLTQKLPLISKDIEADLVSLGVLPKGSFLAVKSELTEEDYSLPQFEFTSSTPFLAYVNGFGNLQWILGKRSHLLITDKEKGPLTISPIHEMILLAEVADPEDSLALFNEIMSRETGLTAMLKTIEDYFYSIADEWFKNLEVID